tara:strand:- start:5 stop:154 length:150 start_codon:yes stop_codon:yes gene_type:complete
MLKDIADIESRSLMKKCVKSVEGDVDSAVTVDMDINVEPCLPKWRDLWF